MDRKKICLPIIIIVDKEYLKKQWGKQWEKQWEKCVDNNIKLPSITSKNPEKTMEEID